MTTKEKIDVMKAYERGEQIEMHAHCTPNKDRWNDIDSPTWNWQDIEYRIKPQSRYRPYKNSDEFLQAQKEHGMYLRLSSTNYSTKTRIQTSKQNYFKNLFNRNKQ